MDFSDIEISRKMSTMDEETFKSITDECFDFDLPLSPKVVEEENEDDIYFGPMGHREKCVTVILEEEATLRDIEPLEPLTAKEHAEIFKEAHTIAYLLKKEAKESEISEGSTQPDSQTVTIDRTKSQLSPDGFASLNSIKRKFDNFRMVEDDENSSSMLQESTKKRARTVGNELEEESEKLSDVSSVSGSNASLLSVENLVTRKGGRLGLRSPKRRISGTSNASDDTESSFNSSTSTNTSSLKPPARKRFALTSPRDSNKALPKPVKQTASDTSLQGRRVRPSASRRSLDHCTLPRPQPLVKPTASGIAAPKSAIKPPSKTIPTGLKQPAVTTTSKLKALGSQLPTCSALPTLSGQSKLAAPISKPTIQPPSQIQRPMSRLQLVKPNAVTQQRKAVHSQAKGPMKATASLQSMSAASSAVPRPASATLPPSKGNQESDEVFQPPPPARSKPVPVLPDAPKSPPSRLQSDSGASSNGTPVLTRSAKRHSGLPTPRRSVGPGTFKSSLSSVSSIDSSFTSPAIRRSTCYADGSPSALLPKRTLVSRTPLSGRPDNDEQLSAWSPVRKAKPISLEEELIQCTKHNKPKFTLDGHF